jgi:SpoVK/Ycf46/Vps4 family AAA+-type ATPase
MAQKFVKNGNRIVPQVEGNIIELQNGKVYNLIYDRYNEVTFLQEDGELNMPSKIYNTEEDTKFMGRVIKYFNHTTSQTTGVLLNGVKGTGKTVMAKLLAIQSNRPIVVVHESTPTSAINDFYKSVKTETVLIFDEIDKEDNAWREDGLLRFLDGVQATSKKLVIMTSNDSDKMSRYLFDRCSRIRYIRHFDPSENTKFILDILNDKKVITDHNLIKNFMVANINLLSIDNILSFIEEILLYEDGKALKSDDLTYIISDMNITTKDSEELEDDDKYAQGHDDKDDDEDDEDGYKSNYSSIIKNINSLCCSN